MLQTPFHAKNNRQTNLQSNQLSLISFLKVELVAERTIQGSMKQHSVPEMYMGNVGQ